MRAARRLSVVALVAAIACGGEDGKDGKDATPYLTSTVPASNADCPNGGTNVLTGPDSNRSGALDIGEILSTATICNGGDGDDGNTDVWLTSAEDADSDSCAWGGTILHFGKDLDVSGTLETGEVLSSRSVCKSPVTANAGTALWTGNGSDNLWSNSDNWSDGILPDEGQNVSLNVSGPSASVNDLPLLFTVNGLTISSGHTVSGNKLAVLTGVTSVANAGLSNVIAAPLVLRGGFFNVQNDAGSSEELVVTGVIESPTLVAFAKTGSGAMVLRAVNTLRGTVELDAGTLRVEGGNAIPDTTAVSCTGGTFEVSAAGETIGDLNGGCAVSLLGDLVVDQISAVDASTGIMSGTGAFVKRSGRDFSLGSPSSNVHTGSLRIEAGGLIVDGSYGASPVTVNPGAALGGGGNVGSIAVATGGLVQPGAGGPANLTASGNVAFASGSTFFVVLNGTTSGSGYSRLSVIGNVNLGGATLAGGLGFAPVNGNTFTIMQVSGGTITGTFAGLANGGTLVIGGSNFTVAYTTTTIALTKAP